MSGDDVYIELSGQRSAHQQGIAEDPLLHHDPDAEILEAARASNRAWARAQEQRLLDAMRSPDA